MVDGDSCSERDLDNHGCVKRSGYKFSILAIKCKVVSNIMEHALAHALSFMVVKRIRESTVPNNCYNLILMKTQNSLL